MGPNRRHSIKKGWKPNVHRASPSTHYCRADHPRDSLCIGVFGAPCGIQAASKKELRHPDTNHPGLSVYCEPCRASVSIARHSTIVLVIVVLPTSPRRPRLREATSGKLSSKRSRVDAMRNRPSPWRGAALARIPRHPRLSRLNVSPA
jgi:hypothetical protein